jgi:hypothetical protein
MIDFIDGYQDMATEQANFRFSEPISDDDASLATGRAFLKIAIGNSYESKFKHSSDVFNKIMKLKAVNDAS